MNRDYVVLESLTLESSRVELRRNSDDSIVVWRKSNRSGISHAIGQYSLFSAQQEPVVQPLDEQRGLEILQRLSSGESFSSAFVFSDKLFHVSPQLVESMRHKSGMEEKFTSTGSKFWKHPQAMRSYKERTGYSVISTHISPEGRCNLACPYCSVTGRRNKNRLDTRLGRLR